MDCEDSEEREAENKSRDDGCRAPRVDGTAPDESDHAEDTKVSESALEIHKRGERSSQRADSAREKGNPNPVEVHDPLHDCVAGWVGRRLRVVEDCEKRKGEGVGSDVEP